MASIPIQPKVLKRVFISKIMKEKTLIILEETFKYGFGVIPFVILRNPKIPAHLKMLYTLLLSYAWYNAECFPGQNRLAEDLGWGIATVNRGLKELKRLNLIDWKRRGLGKTNIYYIKELPDLLKIANLEFKSENDEFKNGNQDLSLGSNKIDKEEIDYNIKYREIDKFSLNDFRSLIKHYFKLKGFPDQRQYYPRFLKRAKELLNLAGDLEGAKEKLNEIKNWDESKGFEWTFETAIKRFFEGGRTSNLGLKHYPGVKEIEKKAWKE